TPARGQSAGSSNTIRRRARSKRCSPSSRCPRIFGNRAAAAAASCVCSKRTGIASASDLLVDGIDFLKVRKAPRGAKAIVINPPFSRAADFVRHGLLLVPKVVLLQRVQWLESDSRADIFNSEKLARVHIFRNRVPRMHRLGWTGNRSSASM